MESSPDFLATIAMCGDFQSFYGMLRNCGKRKIDLIGVALLLLLAGLVHGSYRSGAQWTDALKSVSTEPWKKHYVTKETLISDDENLIVNTKFGPIQGTYAPPELGMKAQDYPYEEQQQNWVRAFLGIPFAKPPVGSRRFQYATRWNETWQDAFGKEILRADKFGPQCLQFIAFPLKNLNEDCLYMNVYIPPAAKVNKDKKLPVLFWYFGGAWVFGNGGVGTVEDKNLYAGNHLLQDNSFILVTANFRIGALGYYTGHNDKGNAGIDDSIAALEFIYENIEQFGGDKENINIAGMSSGAYNALLLAAKHKRPPVKRVFLMSSPMSLKTMPLKDARAKSAAFATKAGCSYDDLECLQKVHPVKLMLSDLDGLGINQKDPLRAPFKWVPTTDEDSQIASPSDLDITRLKDVEVFIGVSEHEAGLFFAFFEFVQGGSLVWLHGERSIWDTMYDWGAALIDLVLRRSQFHGKSLNAAERLYVNSVRSLFGEDSNIVLEKYPPKKTVKDNKEILLNLFTDYIFVCSNRKVCFIHH